MPDEVTLLVYHHLAITFRMPEIKLFPFLLLPHLPCRCCILKEIMASYDPEYGLKNRPKKGDKTKSQRGRCSEQAGEKVKIKMSTSLLYSPWA